MGGLLTKRLFLVKSLMGVWLKSLNGALRGNLEKKRRDTWTIWKSGVLPVMRSTGEEEIVIFSNFIV